MNRQTAAGAYAVTGVFGRHATQVTTTNCLTVRCLTMLTTTLLLSGPMSSRALAVEPMTDTSAAGSRGVPVAQSTDAGTEGTRHALMANDCLPTPQGPVILTVSGVLDCGNAGSADAPMANFDMTMLDALPSRVTATHTPWTQGRISFSGPLIRTLVERVADDDIRAVQARALNDFSAEIPFSDIENYDVLLATHRDGAPMTVRDFGPLFILYPFDSHPELLNEEVRFRSVWQVRELILR